MKNSKRLLLALMVALAGFGCSKPSTINNDSVGEQALTPDYPSDDVITPPDGTGDSGSSTGSSTVTFVPVSFAEMNSYVAIRPLNAPTNFTLSVDLTNDGSNRYYGTIRIGYNDNGTRYEGVFNSGSGTNSYIKTSKSNYLQEYVYNTWFGGSSKFSGFFQDSYGAVILVVDQVSRTGNGDGLGSTVLSGSVWYRNFPYSQAPQSPYRKCWFVEVGPYDCRSSFAISKSTVYPSDTYKKLGTFSGLSLSQAFH